MLMGNYKMPITVSVRFPKQHKIKISTLLAYIALELTTQNDCFTRFGGNDLTIQSDRTVINNYCSSVSTAK